MDLGSDEIADFQYKMSDIILYQRIGKGSYGEVFKARVEGRDEVVAVKKLHGKEINAEHVEAFCAEVSIMCSLEHKNVATFLGAVTEPSNLCIITEYYSRGSVGDMLPEKSIVLTYEAKLQEGLQRLEPARAMATATIR